MTIDEQSADQDIAESELDRFVNSRVTPYVADPDGQQQQQQAQPVVIRYPLKRPWRGYTEKSYWDSRYQGRLQGNEPPISDLGGKDDEDEWYGSCTLIVHLIKRTLATLQCPAIRRVLHLGCGLSRLGEELATVTLDVVHVVNVDFSSSVIRYWNSVETRGEYLEGDVTDMRPIVAAQTQQLVIDKACFDGLTNDAAEHMLIEICRVLVTEGIFVCISSSRRMLTRAVQRISARNQWTLGRLVEVTEVKEYRTDKDDDFVYAHAYQKML